MNILKTSFCLLLTFICTLSFGQISERLPCIDKKFSIVAHIFKDSLGAYNITEPEITAAINSMNNDFTPICVSFEVCEFRYHDNFQHDDHRSDLDWAEMQVLYHVDNRINIYYVNTITDPANACGYAGLGSIGVFTASGIVIQISGGCASAGSKTHSHEMGHYFGLEHTFMGMQTTELVNGSNCTTTADEICDTPADPFVNGLTVSDFVDSDCRFIFMGKDANDEYYDPLVGNMMSYYPDACGCGFTRGQYHKMASTYLNNKGMW